jgi:hypothetical protein
MKPDDGWKSGTEMEVGCPLLFGESQEFCDIHLLLRLMSLFFLNEQDVPFIDQVDV